jgi:hypothetical protein
METPETEGIPPEEQEQEDTGADSAADAARLDETEADTDSAATESVQEELEDRGNV